MVKNFSLQLSSGFRILYLCNKAFIYAIEIAFSSLMLYKKNVWEVFMIHRLSLYLTRALYLYKPGMNYREKQLYLYAFETFISQTLTYSILLIIGLIAHMILPLITYLLFFILLRGQTSGFHTTSQLTCSFLSIFVTSILVYLSSIIPQKSVVLILPLLITSIIYIFLNAPINHKNMNLTTYEINCMASKAKRILIAETIIISIFCLFESTFLLCTSGSFAIITVAISMVLSKILKQEVVNNV